MKEPITIEIWSDVVCPWCYIGKRNLETALQSFPDKDQVTLIFRSFQLDPDSPTDSGEKTLSMLSRKYGVSEADAQFMVQRVSTAAAQAGLEYNLDNTLVTNTLEAHQLIQMGADQGLSGQISEGLFKAYFTDRQDIGRSEVLLRIGSEAGLDPAQILETLDRGIFADQVARDQARARELNITGVPFFYFNDTFGLSGAQPPATLLQALSRAAGPSLKPMRP